MVYGLCFVGCAAIAVVLLVAFTWFCLVAVLLSLLYFLLLLYAWCWLRLLCGYS